jgi:hypothetical protein
VAEARSHRLLVVEVTRQMLLNEPQRAENSEVFKDQVHPGEAAGNFAHSAVFYE